MRRFLSLTLSALLIAQTAHAADSITVISAEQDAAKQRRIILKSTLTEGRYIFEICRQIEMKSLDECEIIGSSKGYTREQLLSRSKELALQRRIEYVFDAVKVVLGVAAGAATGLVAGVVSIKVVPIRETGDDYQDAASAALRALGGMALGAGGGGSLVYYFVAGSELTPQIAMLSNTAKMKSNETPFVQIELKDVEMAKALHELNTTLAGIP